MTVSTATTTTLALKEWGAVAHALLDGRQTLLLRKGGIHEKRFDVAVADGDRFVLFPTVAHSHAERVRPEHADVLAPGPADVDDDAFTVRVGITLVDAVPVAHPERLEEVADLHIWTSESVRTDRLEFRPKHQLNALVVRAVALPEPVRVTRTEDLGGCRSWVDLPVTWDGRAGRRVHAEDRLAADAERVREALASGSPSG
jgi:hypothetical protein